MKQHATLAWLRAVMVLAAALPIVMFIAVAWNLHNQALADAQVRVNSAARIAKEHALKTFETNVALLNRVGDGLAGASDEMLRANERQLHDKLVQMGAGLPQLQGIFVMGTNGRMVATNRLFPAPSSIDYTDRPSFLHHRNGGPQPYFTDLLTSRATGEPFFDMSVRRTLPDGSWAGILSISMTPAYFSGFYRELTGNDPELKLALLRSDGAMLAGWPAAPITNDSEAASARSAGGAAASHLLPPLLGPGQAGDRLFADRQLNAYPIHVVAWQDRSAVLAPWYRDLAVLAGFTFPSALTLVYVAWVALQRTQRSLQVLQTLNDETAHRHRAEEALRQAQKLEAMGRLSGGVAHDFNNLLMVMGNNLYLHRKLQPAVADSPQLGAIDRAVAAGTQLTRQLLSFSSRQPLRPEQVFLQQRLSSMADLLAPAVGTAISIEARCQPDTAAIEVDVAELDLALLNLAINARDAMPQGGRLQLLAANAPAGEVPGLTGQFVVLSVADNGVGIEPALVERVFEPFFTTKEIGHGTGLGLSQVYGFCARAGGTATLESRLGQGTRVHMYFPVASVELRPPVAKPSTEDRSLHGLRVLLVEDHDDVAAATAGVLDSMGCQVRRLANAEQALALLATQASAFDIMLTDIVMSGAVDGIELVARSLVDHPDLPVLLMSGYADSMQRATALGLDVLAKPCTPGALSAAIRAALAHARVSRPQPA